MNVLLIDDHPMVNSGLASILEETGRFRVTGQVTSLTEAKKFIQETIFIKTKFPSFIILDISLNDENGLDFLPFLENFCKEKKISMPFVLICSVLEEPIRIQSALKMGASGYVSKASSKDELLKAIDAILNEEIYLSEKQSDKINKSYRLYSKFTKREMEIFALMKEKKSNKQIADELGINFRTIENHVSNIYFKTGTANRDELMKL